jgi:hypothetical protein
VCQGSEGFDSALGGLYNQFLAEHSLVGLQDRKLIIDEEYFLGYIFGGLARGASKRRTRTHQSAMAYRRGEKFL